MWNYFRVIGPSVFRQEGFRNDRGAHGLVQYSYETTSSNMDHFKQITIIFQHRSEWAVAGGAQASEPWLSSGLHV